MNENKIYALCEDVADIAFIAGAAKYYSGDSREDIANFIAWAKEFEEQNNNIEWGVTSEDDYIDAICKFTEYKMEKIH